MLHPEDPSRRLREALGSPIMASSWQVQTGSLTQYPRQERGPLIRILQKPRDSHAPTGVSHTSLAQRECTPTPTPITWLVVSQSESTPSDGNEVSPPGHLPKDVQRAHLPKETEDTLGNRDQLLDRNSTVSSRGPSRSHSRRPWQSHGQKCRRMPFLSFLILNCSQFS